MVTPALCLIKSSLFIQYYLIFRPLRWIRTSVWIGATISALFYITVTITAFVLETPRPGESFVDDILSSHYLKFSDFSIPTGVVGMLVDWAAVASITSLYYRVQLQNNIHDSTWGVGYVLLWAQIEMFAGVAASSMPTVHQFLHRQNISVVAWISSWKSNLTRTRSSSAHGRLPDDNKFVLNQSRSVSRKTSEAYQDFRTKSVEMENRHGKASQDSWTGDSQIRLTHDISVSREIRMGS
ncbi:MAG: hypothetical protein Q9167_005637 [Letrouitia subvulpina]